MVSAYATIFDTSQFGNVHVGVAPYAESEGNDAVAGRSVLARFAHVPIPRGSTLNSGQLWFWVSSKTPDQNSSANITWQVETTNASNPFRQDVYEDSNRTWTTISTFNVVFTANAGSRQLQMFNLPLSTIQSKIGDASWTNPSPLAFRMYFNSESGDISFMRTDGASDIANLTIDYTPPGSPPLTPVVNYAENPNFTLPTHSGGADTTTPWHWVWNSWFGTYGSQPTVTMPVTENSISAPFGGNMMKMTATGTGKIAMLNADLYIAKAIGVGWYTMQAWVYVPASTPGLRITNLQTSKSSATSTTTGAWTKISSSFLITKEEVNPWFAIESESNYTSGQFAYVANFSITPGRYPPEALNGSITDTGTHVYKYCGGGVSCGAVVEAASPTATWTSLHNTTVRGGTTAEWTYSGQGTQSRYILEWRKV